MITPKESDYNITLEKLYETNRLLISALFEICGDDIKSASLFCLDNGINLKERDKIMLLLNKYSKEHGSEYLDFWKELLVKEVPKLSELSNEMFQKMICLFWKNYVILE